MVTSENGLIVDIEGIQEIIDTSDVFAVGFRLFPERLFVDTRVVADAGPMITMVEPVESLPARFHWLGRARPQFGLPERFMFVPWPHSLQFFEEAGLLDRIRERLVSAHPEMAARCDEVFAELRSHERAGIVEAIQGGDHYRTLWPSPQ